MLKMEPMEDPFLLLTLVSIFKLYSFLIKHEEFQSKPYALSSFKGL